jgi:hypothetical protein
MSLNKKKNPTTIQCGKDFDISPIWQIKSFYYLTEKALTIGFIDKKKYASGGCHKNTFENNYHRPIFSDSGSLYLS